jgi:hypothetical protein
MNAKIRRLVEKRRRLLGHLAGLQRLVHGSYVERFSTCSRTQCACHRGQRHGPRAYVVVYRHGRQRQVYIRRDQVPVVRRGLQEDQRAAELLRDITDVNLALMRAGALDTAGETDEEKQP